MKTDPGEVAVALNVAAVTGQPFPSDVPDTPANRAAFDRMIAFADDAREQGMIIDIPAE